MGWFSFGKKRRELADQSLDEAQEDLESAGSLDEQDSQIDVNEDAVQADDFPPKPRAEYYYRGMKYGPWDVNDNNVVDYDSYLDLGAFYLPFLQGIQLRIKATRAQDAVLGVTITYGHSSLQIEAYAAPKSTGIWDSLRTDLLAAHSNAKAVEGVFGTELMLPVAIKGQRTVMTRIVGIDGPRWMLRGIFSGRAAQGDNEERDTLNKFFADIVVDRGEEPLAPRDLIPMHHPVTPAQRNGQLAQGGDNATIDSDVLTPPQGPFDSDQQTQVKTTLARGPMFSEVR